MIEIFAFNITENIEKANFYGLSHLVSKEKQTEIKRLARYEDAWRSLFSGILLRAVVCEKLGARNSDIVIVRNDYGKPFLSSTDNPLYSLAFLIPVSG